VSSEVKKNKTIVNMEMLLFALNQLKNKIGLTFKNPTLLQTALTHSSYLNENPGAFAFSNERLELLGDAVLGLVITERLFWEYPEYDEGKLTRLRSALVRRETLAKIAATIELGEYLYLSKGEAASGGRTKSANLASALEALIAAAYLDRGLSGAKQLISSLFDTQIRQSARFTAETDYKSRLQEIMQSRQQGSPSYVLVEAAGPDHNRRFTVEVRIGNKTLGRGIGKSKKAAEMEAAKEALQNL